MSTQALASWTTDPDMALSGSTGQDFPHGLGPQGWLLTTGFSSPPSHLQFHHPLQCSNCSLLFFTHLPITHLHIVVALLKVSHAAGWPLGDLLCPCCIASGPLSTVAWWRASLSTFFLSSWGRQASVWLWPALLYRRWQVYGHLSPCPCHNARWSAGLWVSPDFTFNLHCHQHSSGYGDGLLVPDLSKAARGPRARQASS